MNDFSLSSLYRRMPGRVVDMNIDADAFSAAASGDELPAERREAVAAVVARSSAHASLARMLRALQPESEALATAVTAKPHVAHPSRSRDARVAAGARRPHHGRHRLRWVGAIAACFVFAFALNFRQGEAPVHWDDVSASADSVALPDRIFTTQDRIFASVDAPAPAPVQSDRLFQADFAIGG